MSASVHRSPLSASTGPWRFLRRAVVAAAVAGALALAAPVPAHADVDDFTFDSFHAEMMLERGADEHSELAVTETIVARFPEDEEQNRGIVRAIPDDYDGVPLRTEVLSVTDADGDDVPYELSEDDGFIEVATGDDSYVFGAQTYVISYTQRDVVRAFEDTASDEFQRDINGTGWDQPFGEVSATLTIADAELAADLTGNAACYRGEQGSDDACEIERSDEGGTAVLQASVSDLEPEENLTIVVGFEQGSFVPGEVERNGLEQFAFDATPAVQGGSVATIALALAAAVAAVVGRRRTRDAPGRGVIVPEYAPPRGLPVMQAAHLAGRSATAVPAALLDLAVSGHVRILAEEGEDTATGVTLEHVRPGDTAERREVLEALFGVDPEAGARKRIDPESQALAKRLADVADRARLALRESGLAEQPRQRLTSVAISAAMGVFLLGLVCFILGVLGRTVSWLSGAGLVVAILAGVVAFSLWRYRDRVTDAGAPVRDHLVGLRDYLRLAEEDRLRVLQSPDGAERIDTGEPLQVVRVYERLLPYAVIWGVEKDWAEVLELRARDAGAAFGWYDGGAGFSSTRFLATYAALNAGSSPASAWSASGSGSYTGGSTGAGFSGMGAGGGGGGGR